jgi:two-component system response regulator ChvI
MQPIRVLFVEDDPGYRAAFADELTDHGFSVRSFPDSTALLDSLEATADADVILLDWTLPEISGLDLMAELRRTGVTLPVVFLTGYSTVTNENRAFAQGASDFIDKARGVEIVARRLKLVAETDTPRPRPPADERLSCGKLVLDPPNGRASWGDVDVNLTVTEYSVVDLLVSNVGCYLSYRAIYDRMRYEGFVGGLGDEGYRTNVRSCIKRIRRKFCKVDPAFAEIQTSASFGYRWRGLTAGIGDRVSRTDER